MMLYKYTKQIVRSPKTETDFFYIVTRVFQGDILVP